MSKRIRGRRRIMRSGTHEASEVACSGKPISKEGLPNERTISLLIQSNVCSRLNSSLSHAQVSGQRQSPKEYDWKSAKLKLEEGTFSVNANLRRLKSSTSAHEPSRALVVMSLLQLV